MLKRKLYDRLCSWKNERQGKSVILLEGARRVGKSYVARCFGREQYRSCLVVDFSEVPKQVLELFEHDLGDLDYFFNMLSIYYGVKLFPRASLIIFDEIQMYPKIRQFVKVLVRDGRYDYLETGSWISLRRNVQHIVIPKEEECVTVYPLDFEEFLWAMGDRESFSQVRECYQNKRPLGPVMHHNMMKQFRQYMLVGGMPQAVLAYVDSKDFQKTEEVKRSILSLYKNDVGMYAGAWERKIMAVFDGIPSQLSKTEKKYTLATLQKEARLREYRPAFDWLEEANIVDTCYNNSDPQQGLKKNEERVSLKCYMADTGLLVSHVIMKEDLLAEDICKAILFDELHWKEGMLLENVVAQSLSSSGHELLFYSHSDNKDATNRMKVDFLIQQKKKICPITVKAENYRRHVSMDKFSLKYKEKLGERYVIYTKDLTREGDVWYIPVYMTSCM